MKQFLYVDSNGDYTEGYNDGHGEIRSCDSSLAVGDLVYESETIANGVDKVVDNSDVRSVIGYVIDKPSATVANIIRQGTITGTFNLTKAAKVYLSDTGTLTDTKPTYGYQQILGFAVDSNTIDFDPSNTKIKLYKEMFAGLQRITLCSARNVYNPRVINEKILIGDHNNGANYNGRIFYYTYINDTATAVQTIDNPNPDGNNNAFGKSLEMYGDYFVAGAPGRRGDYGAAFVYKYNGSTWGKVYHSYGQDNSHAGERVGINDKHYFYSEANAIKIRSYSNNSLIQTISNYYKSFSVFGDRLYMTTSATEVKVYDWDGSAYTNIATITLPSATITRPDALDGDENSFCVCCGANLYIYKKTGSSWTLYDTLSFADSSNNNNATISEKYNMILLGNIEYDTQSNSNIGRLRMFTDNGTEYILSQTFDGDNTDNFRFGYGSYFSDNGFLVATAYQHAYLLV